MSFLSRILGTPRKDMVGLYKLAAKGEPFVARARIKSFVALYGGLRGGMEDPDQTIGAILATRGITWPAVSAGVSRHAANKMLRNVCVAVCTRCRKELSGARLHSAPKSRAGRCLYGGCRGNEVLLLWGYSEPSRHKALAARGVEVPARDVEAVEEALYELAAVSRLWADSGFAASLQGALGEVMHERY